MLPLAARFVQHALRVSGLFVAHLLVNEEEQYEAVDKRTIGLNTGLHSTLVIQCNRSVKTTAFKSFNTLTSRATGSSGFGLKNIICRMNRSSLGSGCKHPIRLPNWDSEAIPFLSASLRSDTHR